MGARAKETLTLLKICQNTGSLPFYESSLTFSQCNETCWEFLSKSLESDRNSLYHAQASTGHTSAEKRNVKIAWHDEIWMWALRHRQLALFSAHQTARSHLTICMTNKKCNATPNWKLTLPLSSNFVSMTITDDICSHIMRQKSSNVSINGPTQEGWKRNICKLFWNAKSVDLKQ